MNFFCGSESSGSSLVLESRIASVNKKETFITTVINKRANSVNCIKRLRTSFTVVFLKMRGFTTIYSTKPTACAKLEQRVHF